MLRILSKLPKNKFKLIENVVTQKRYIRGLPRQKEVLRILPNQNGEQPDEVEMARKELAELTGGMDLEQLKQMLKPSKAGTKLALTLKQKNQQQEVQHSVEEKLPLQPTYNLAAYVNKSELLQGFIKLGVDLSSFEKRKGLPEFVLKLDLEKDVHPRLLFLQDQGVAAEHFGELITKNPLIFKVELDDMQTRVNYLESKKFTKKQIQRILTLNPYWIMFSTRRVDKRLGYFQKEFALSGDDVRFLSSKQPRLITYNMQHIQDATFCIREEMGFNKEEIKVLLLSKPRLWMLKPDDLVERFAYAHQEMKLSHEMLLQQPEILASREFRLRERHEFLKMLGRAQYDPQKDMYISPKIMVEGNNFHFVRKIAKSDMETFELFLKSR